MNAASHQLTSPYQAPTAFVVRSSEDGTLGVYTTREKARRKAIGYLVGGLITGTYTKEGEKQVELVKTIPGNHSTPADRVAANRANFRSVMLANGFVVLEWNHIEVTITEFEVNA